MTPPDEPGLDHDQLRALCDEATGLIKHLTGPVSKVSIRAGEYHVEVEWDPTRTASVAVAGGAPVAIGEAEATGPRPMTTGPRSSRSWSARSTGRPSRVRRRSSRSATSWRRVRTSRSSRR